MHDAVPLSVEDARSRGTRAPRLVVLSACETGLYDITNSPDEFIGLPATFTALGAAGVLGTLWPVSDAATALLTAKLDDLHLEGWPGDPPDGVEPGTGVGCERRRTRISTGTPMSPRRPETAKRPARVHS